jgi:hypothetical protein
MRPMALFFPIPRAKILLIVKQKYLLRYPAVVRLFLTGFLTVVLTVFYLISDGFFLKKQAVSPDNLNVINIINLLLHEAHVFAKVLRHPSP